MAGPSVGTRLQCGACGTEIIVVKAPDGSIVCCGQPMGTRQQEGVTGGEQPR